MKRRRNFSASFKKEAVKLVREHGLSAGKAAKELGISESALRRWIEASDIEQGNAGGADSRREGRDPRAQARAGDGPDGARYLKKGSGLLRQGKSMRFEFIDAEKHNYPLATLCRVMQVSRAATTPGFSASPAHGVSAMLSCWPKIRTFYKASGKRYGSPRIYDDLRADREQVSQKRVARLMRENGIVGKHRRRFKSTTDSDHDLAGGAQLA
jgi:transposase-like protein